MYPLADPRRALASVQSEPIFPLRAPQFIEFKSTTPSAATTRGSLTWFVRSENLVIGYTRARAGDTFDCSSDTDEMALVLADDRQSASLTFAATGSTSHSDVTLGPASYTVVPPGTASVRVDHDGVLIRIFAARSTRFAQRSVNAGEYESSDANIPPFATWEVVCKDLEPATYSFGDVRSVPGRFGRIFRTDSSMINLFYPEVGPRDASALSPHSHDHFDQISLQLVGDYIHHVRTPWGPDSSQWRDDVHHRSSSPAIAVFPPPLIHTSQAVGIESHQLIDIFGPPRSDFAARDGWLLNGTRSTDG